MSEAFVSSFAYCRDIKTTNNEYGNVTQITLLPYLNINMLSETYSLKAICAISGIDFNKDNSLDVYFVDPEENILIQHSHKILLEMIKKYGKKTPEALLLNIDLATDFKKTGLYKTKIIFNDTCIGTFKISILESDINA